MSWPKFFDRFKLAIRWGGRNQKQTVKNSQNVVQSQARKGSATSTVAVQVVVERHGYSRTPTELFGDFDHAIEHYKKQADAPPPAILVNDWDVMVIQMLFRDNSPLKDKIRLVDGVMTYDGIPLKHPTAGKLQMLEPPPLNESDSPTD